MKARMTWFQKDARREARKLGLFAVSSIETAIAHQHEANLWRRAGFDEDGERTKFWQARSNAALNAAVRHARLAARYALQSMEAPR